MTGDMPEPGADPAMPDGMLDVISTFLDGERVDPDELKRALESPEGRDYLVDLLTLREAIGGLGPFAAVPRKPAPVWTLLRGSAAAAILILALAGGYIAGHRGERAGGSCQRDFGIAGARDYLGPVSTQTYSGDQARTGRELVGQHRRKMRCRSIPCSSLSHWDRLQGRTNPR